MALILIVDDTAMFRDSVMAFLADHGYETFDAEDGGQALAFVEMRTPDLIILDQNMPVMNGIQFLTKLRSQEKFHDVSVIMLTGEAGRRHIVSAAKLGVKEYILKTEFTVDQLLHRVQRVIGGENPAVAATGVGNDSSL